MLRKALIGGLAALGLGALAPAPVRAQLGSQCVNNVYAQGTANAITSVSLPCAFTTNIVLLSNQFSNTSSSVTFTPLGLSTQPIQRFDGTPLQVGDLVAGGVSELTPTGTKWLLLNPSTSAGLTNLVVPGQFATIALAQAACPAAGCTIEIQDGYTIAGATFTQGQNLQFDCGSITVSATIVFQNIKGGIYSGCGTNRNSINGGTNLVWTGNNSTAMLSLQAVQFSVFQGFTIQVGSGTLNTGIEIPNVLAGTSTQDTFQDFIISGVAGNLNYGMQIGNYVAGGPGTAQGDQMNIGPCLIENYALAGISIEYAQSKYERITGCSINGDFYGAYGVTTALNGSNGGSFIFRNGSMTQNYTDDFYLGSVTDNITIDSSLFEGSAQLLAGTTSGSSMWPVTVSNNRFTADGVDSGGVILSFSNEGPLVLLNNVFGTGYTHGSNLTVNSSRGTAIGIGNAFYNGANPPYTGNFTWEWFSTIVGSGGSPVAIPDYVQDISVAGSVGVVWSMTPPVFTSGACTGAIGTNPNGTAAFQVTTGSGSCGSTFTLAMPTGLVTNGWMCDANDVADNGWIKQTSQSTTSLVFTHEMIGTLTPSNFTASHTIGVKCMGD